MHVCVCVCGEGRCGWRCVCVYILHPCCIHPIKFDLHLHKYVDFFTTKQ